MPIPTYTPGKLKKTKKDDLIIHILDLYSFIEIFDNKSIKHITTEEPCKAKLQEENEKLKIEIEEHGSIIEKLDHRIADVRAENKKLEGLKSHAIDIAAGKGIEIEKLEKELYRYKDVPQLGRNYQIVCKENKRLKEEIEKAIEKLNLI